MFCAKIRKYFFFHLKITSFTAVKYHSILHRRIIGTPNVERLQQPSAGACYNPSLPGILTDRLPTLKGTILPVKCLQNIKFQGNDI